MQAFFMGSKSKKIEYPAFTNFTIKVEVNKSYHDTVKMVLRSVEGVTAFKMKDDGTVNVSGCIDPIKLLNCLKKAGKKAEMVQWQYGECSNNMFQTTEQPTNDTNDNGNEAGYFYPGYYNGNGYENGYGYGNGHRYDLGYPINGRNFAYNHLECSGNAEDCSGHHMKQAPKDSDKSSFSIPKKITASEEDPIPMPGENDPKCCSLM